ncbi:MAG: hypothetical protein NTV58_08570 [Deltaproteobacteria bacterium]|nr:hypothetical protein [Deltaproteobacteria bacterium]
MAFRTVGQLAIGIFVQKCMPEKYYWAVLIDDIYNSTYSIRAYLFQSKYKYNFKLGDKLYFYPRLPHPLTMGYLDKNISEDSEDFVYPIKYGRNISDVEIFILFKKLQKIVIKNESNHTTFSMSHNI